MVLFHCYLHPKDQLKQLDEHQPHCFCVIWKGGDNFLKIKSITYSIRCEVERGEGLFSAGLALGAKFEAGAELLFAA